MRLIDTIQRSTSTILAKRTAEENKQSQDKYATALTKLSKVSNSINASLDCETSMQENHLVASPLITAEMRDTLINYANICGKGIYDGTLSMEMVKDLQMNGDTFSSQISIVWKDAAQKYAEGPQGYLATIANLTDNPKHARELVDDIAKTSSGNMSSKAIQKLVKDVAEAKSITNAFSLNDNIEGFLKKVSTQKATLLDLTPDIIAWLQEKNLTSKLKIRF